MSEKNANFICSRAIGIAGAIGSGKSELAKSLSLRFDGVNISFGSFIKEAAQKRNIRPERSNLQQLGEQLISELGPEEFAQQVLQDAFSKYEIVIVDGIRHAAVWEAIQNLVPQTCLIYIEVDDTTRLERLSKRDGTSIEEVNHMTQHSMEIGAVELKLRANIVLASTGLEDMVSAVDKLFE